MSPEMCGTWAGVKRHQRAGESLAAGTTVCEACTVALSEHNRAQYLRRRGEQAGRER